MAIRKFIFFLFTFLILNTALAQTKSKGKKSEIPTFSQKVYHDMTTRFNYFFNARLKLNQSLQQIQASNKDNYDELLPVRVYGDKDKRSSMSPAMDEVVKKSSTAIQLHKISKWVDDCYLLLAKANFFKGDYDGSLEALNYIDAEYSSKVRNTKIIITEYDKELKKREEINKENETGKSKEQKEIDAIRKKRNTERENALREREIAKEERAKKKEAQKAKKGKKKEQEDTRKDAAKERDSAKKEKDKERKERVKEREKEAKERAKDRNKKSSKDYNKDKAKAAKERQKGQSAKDYNKAKKKAAKERAKGKKPSAKEKEKINAVYDELAAQKDKADETTEMGKKETEEQADKEVALDKAEEATAKEEKEVSKREKEAAKKAEKEAKKKRKKEEQEFAENDKASSDFSGKGDSGNGFGHKLVTEEAQLWLAENYMEMGEQMRAMAIIDQIAAENNLPKKLREQYYTLKAIYAIDNELWADGAEALKNAIKHTRKRTTKARYYFILAQINQKQENYGAATASFKKVLKNRPIYDMEFNSRLKIAQTLMLSDPSSKNIAIKSLKKMLKDEKNIDYADQIHFTLAEVEIAAGNVEGAIESLKESASSSTTNKNQKGQSFLKLAEIYFDQEEYQNSAAFYDSAMVFISKDLENYDEIKERKETLVSLASYLYTVELEDSLQKLANLPAAVRNDIIDQKIDEIIDAATKANEETAQGADFSDMTDLNQNTSVAPAFNKPGQAQTFYFYNETSKGKGFTNFKNRWGNRNLSDWWALTSKAGDDAGEGDDIFQAPAISSFGETENELQELAIAGELDRDVFLAQLPLDEASLQTSNDRILEGLYQSGNIYKEKLQKNEEAKIAYNRLLADFAKNPYDLETNYQLYLIYKEENNTALSNKHKQYIIDNFPDSNYAQIIGNPDYAATLNAVDGEINDHYEATYDLFKREAYEQVIEKTTTIGNDYSVNPLKHKFDFLAAQAIGYTQEETAYVSALENIINNYPGTDVEEASKNILTAIKEKPADGVKGAEENKPAGDTNKYKTNLEEKHFVLIHYPKKTNDIKIVQNELSLFNKEFFSLEKYKVNDNLIDNKNHILVVRTFKDGKDAVTYYNSLRQNGSAALGKANSSYSIFAISKSNFPTYLSAIRNGNETAVYNSFFEATYLNQ